MPNLTIKNVPAALHRSLKRLAEEEGRSLNAHVILELESSVAESKRRKLMRDHRAEFRSFVASLRVMGDSASLIREDRDRGHR